MDRDSKREEEKYVYDRLVHPSSIRLFQLLPGTTTSPIVGRLREVELLEDADVAPDYAALSYTWDLTSDKPEHIFIDGRWFAVRNNLFVALQALRDSRVGKMFWIDAICIYSDRSKIKRCRNLRREHLFSEGFDFAQFVCRFLGALKVCAPHFQLRMSLLRLLRVGSRLFINSSSIVRFSAIL